MYRSQVVVLLAAMSFAWAAPTTKFSGESALGFTSRIVAIGPRPVSTPEHRRMEQLITSQLNAWGCKPEELTWTAQTPFGPKAMKNIVLRTGSLMGRPVVITGHYDTKIFPNTRFVGANDGGSSAGMLLELARVLCSRKSAEAVWLVWLDGEEATRHEWSDEDSLYGSRWLAAKWSQDGTAKKIKALINVDMIGDKDLALLQDMNSSNQLRELVWATAREMGLSQYFAGPQSAIADDHIPFGKAGIPVLDLIDFDYGPMNAYWHTDRDTLDKLSARSFQVIGDVLLRVIGKLGGK